MKFKEAVEHLNKNGDYITFHFCGNIFELMLINDSIHVKTDNGYKSIEDEFSEFCLNLIDYDKKDN